MAPRQTTPGSGSNGAATSPTTPAPGLAEATGFGIGMTPEDLMPRPSVTQREGERRIQVRGAGSRNSTLLPAWLGEEATHNELLLSPYKQMSGAERENLQKAMWMAGFYGDQAIIERRMPNFGYWTDADQQAWTMLIQSTMAVQEADATSDQPYATQVQALDEVLNERLRSYSSVRSLAAEAYRIPDETVVTTDPAALEAMLQQESLDRLGRRLSPEEVGPLVAVLGNEELASFQREIAAKRNIAQSELNRVLAASGESGTSYPGADLIWGHDGSAIEFGKSIASQFGVAVTADRQAPTKALAAEFAEGRAVKVNGDPAQLQALQDWATANSADQNSPVEKVWMTKTGLAIVFRDGAVRPATAGQGPVDSTASFLSAVRLDGGPEVYTNGLDATRNRKGAYQVPVGEYERLAQLEGLPTNDTSVQAQDRIARRWAAQLYNRYQDWELVAAHWYGGSRLARRWHAVNEGATGTEATKRGHLDGIRTSVDTVMARMAGADSLDHPLADFDDEWSKVIGASGIAGGNLQVVEGWNAQAAAIKQVEQTHGTEIQAYGALSGFETMARMLGQAGGAFSAGDVPTLGG